MAAWNPPYRISSQFVDGQLIASSEQTSHTGAAASKIYAGGWVAAENDVDPWLQLDFLTNVIIFSMNSKKGNFTGNVTAFTVAYSDGSKFVNYTQDGQAPKVRNYF